MMRTISRLFDSHEEAVRAVRDLESAGIAHDDISLISNDARRTSEARAFAPAGATDPKVHLATPLQHSPDHEDNVHASHGVEAGAAIGAGVGGGASLLAGLGLLAIPGMGPVLGAGFLASALAGAAAGAMTGGMIGAMRDSGLSESEANTLAEGVRRGGAIVSVRAPEDRAAAVEEILVRHGGVEEADRRRDYQGEGWTGYEDRH